MIWSCSGDDARVEEPSETQWVGFFAVMQPIVPLVVDGKELQAEYRGVPEV
jgi:hypothetical protein